MSKLTWRQFLVYTAYVFAALAIAGFAFTLYQWIQNPSDGPWEPLNVLADNAFSLFSAVASFVALRSSRKASDKPVTFFSSPPESLSDANWQRYRENTLRNLESNWIKGYLKNAVHKAVEIELGLTYQPEAVSRTWGMSLKRPDQESEAIPANKSIYKIFEENGRSLLILGEPASGKTITMLQLAESLIRKAQKDKIQPIPLILNLSSWGAGLLPLADWLVEEILLQYQVPRGLTRSWVAHGHMLLLLDGLDEVTKNHRDDCVQAINEFKAQYAIEVVVCSRVQDYEQLKQRLNLPNAILIQPLTIGETDRYLARFGDNARGIRAALADDEELQELAKSPLLLSLMPIAYGGLDRSEIATSASLDTHRRQLLDIYIGRMFERRPLPRDVTYAKGLALQWLSSLASGMRQHNQSDFYIERLQPTWLPNESLRQRHRVLASLTVGLVGGLIVGLVGGLVDGLIAGLVGGLFFGLFFGLDVRLEIEPKEKLSWLRPNRKQAIKLVKEGLVCGLVCGPLFGLVFALVAGLDGGLVIVLGAGLVFGLIFGPFVGIGFGLVGIVNNSVQISKARQQLTPNQAIYNSGRNALIMTLFFGLGVLLLFGLFFGLGIGRGDWLDAGLFYGLILGLIFGLGKYGGNAVVQHYTLRLLLARHNIIPFARDKTLIDYLDKMVERILLRRVGGGWVFIHRYLLEHFAALHPEANKDNPTNL